MSKINRGKARACAISIDGKTNTLLVQEGAMIDSVVISIKGRNNIVTIEEGANLHGGEILVHGERTQVRIGRKSQLESVSIVAGGGEPILIGARCSLGGGSMVRNVGIDPFTGAKPIFISENTVIGPGVRIFKGTLIEQGAEIPSHSVVAGFIPGKRITALAPERIRNAL